jgi:Amt family ammonium transporter
MIYFNLDDPIDAGPVHRAAGLWGVLAVGLFDKDKGVFYGDNGTQLGTQFMVYIGNYIVVRNYKWYNFLNIKIF